jgi:hypothetical protein
VKLVADASGTINAIPVTTMSGKTGVANAPAPKIGDPTAVGAKSLTPGQRITLEGKADVYNKTIDLAERVMKKLPLLNSILDAKKIDINLDPKMGFAKALLARNLPMSKEERELASDFISLMEHINSVRGPLGAVGFRGPEAFAALQAQRGQMLANPAITSGVLENTLKVLRGQRDVVNKGLGRGMPAQPQQLPSPGAVAPEGETEDQKIERLAKKHG